MQLKRHEITDFCRRVASGCSSYDAFCAVIGGDMFASEEVMRDIAAKLAIENEIEIATIRKRNMLANIDVTTLNSAEMSLQDIKAMLSNFARESENYEVVEGRAIVMNSRKDRLQSLKMLFDIHAWENAKDKVGEKEEEPKTIFSLRKND